jgi:hypothetical protein
MAMINIAGIDMPDPCSLKLSRIDISTSKSGRDECGDMHKMIICKKRKYEISWRQLDPAQAQVVLSAAETGAHVQCSIYDPYAGQVVTGVYTVGDREAEWQQWMDLNARAFDQRLFKTISFNLIEV